MFKNKNIQIALGVVLFVIIFLGLFSFVSGQSKAKPEEKQSSEAVVQTLKPEEIGLKLKVSSDKKKVTFSIDKAKDIKAIEYELTYEADSTAQEKSDGGDDRVQRGITGEAEIKPGVTTFTSENLDLGSCSRNVCRYDSGIKSIQLTLKITKDHNKVFVVQDSLEL